VQTHKISFLTAVFMIVANTIGTGVFTSLGFQLEAFSNPLVILALWILGGMTALCGAFLYSELESRFPGSGGETHFAQVLYGPGMGFLAGWVSIIAGFAIPIAATAYACSRYLLPTGSPENSYLFFAAFLVVAVSILNFFSTRLIGRVQNFFVILKICMILGLSFLLFSKTNSGDKLVWTVDKDFWHSVLSAPFAISLVFVGFAYSGWNAVVYIAKEVDNKVTALPRAMFYGTAITVVLYLLFNMSLMVSTPLHLMSGKLEVASASALFHMQDKGLILMKALLSLSLFTCLTSLIWAGSHVVMKCADNYPLFHFALFRRNDCEVRSTILLSSVALVILATMDFQKMILSTGFLLVFFSLVCAFGLVWHRSFKTMPEKKVEYLASFYPWSAIFFILINLWVAVFLLKTEKSSVNASLFILGLGLLVYRVQYRLTQTTKTRIFSET